MKDLNNFFVLQLAANIHFIFYLIISAFKPDMER